MQIMLVTGDRPTMHTQTIKSLGPWMCGNSFHSKKEDGTKKMDPINEGKNGDRETTQFKFCP